MKIQPSDDGIHIVQRVAIAILFAIIIFVCAVYGLLYVVFRRNK